MSVSEFMYIHAYCDLCDKIILKRAVLLMSDHRCDGIDFRLVTVNVIFTSCCYTVMSLWNMCLFLLMLSRDRIRYAWFSPERKPPSFKWTPRRGNKWRSEV